jgi:hypothetical protein
MKRWLVIAIALAACHAPSPALAPSPPEPLPARDTVAIDTTPKERRRMLPPEAYLRAYLGWFGGLAPLDVQARAKPKNLFDAWDDYLAALGLPDYRIDVPRQTQSNTLMLATLGRLGEALCVRAAEHDFAGKTPKDQRVVFAFDAQVPFADGFDVLHRTFLGYPVALAPKDRLSRFNTLYQYSLGRHKKPEMAWAAVCTALVQHPEAELY